MRVELGFVSCLLMTRQFYCLRDRLEYYVRVFGQMYLVRKIIDGMSFGYEFTSAVYGLITRECYYRYEVPTRFKGGFNKILGPATK